MSLFNFFKKQVLPPKLLPRVVISQLRKQLPSSYVAPNPWIYAECFDQESAVRIARVDYGISPLRDRIYIGMIEVERSYWRQGYASSILLSIARQCSDPGQLMPITGLHEWETAAPFWDTLRRGHVQGLEVTMSVIGESERAADRQRWKLKTV